MDFHGFMPETLLETNDFKSLKNKLSYPKMNLNGDNQQAVWSWDFLSFKVQVRLTYAWICFILAIVGKKREIETQLSNFNESPEHNNLFTLTMWSKDTSVKW